MKRQSGFTLIEVLVATAILVIAIAATLSALTDAIHANQGVTLMADTQENLRAAMNYMVRDIVQAGEGIPQGGITIPNNGLAPVAGGAPAPANSNLNRPGLSPTALPIIQFPTTYTTLPAVTPGSAIGEPQSNPSATVPNVFVASATGTDVITVTYVDNTLVDTTFPAPNNHTLSEFPIFLTPSASGPGCAPANPSPAPNGKMTIAGNTLTVNFDPTCININTGNTSVKVGDLILFQNGQGMALEVVTGVSLPTDTLTFSAAGDSFNLNASGLPFGTIANIETAPGSGKFPPTTATRIWMVTYYLDTQTNPAHPELMRQVNFNIPTAVGEVIEDLGISYDLTEPGAIPPEKNVPDAVFPDSVAQIRKVDLFLAARSENAYKGGTTYFRNNLATEVNVRSLSFVNQFR